jgi:hypothetical protein
VNAQREAMWSVHFFATDRRPSALPRALRPMPVADALDVLRNPADEHDLSRRRRALPRLLEARRHAPELHEPATAERLASLAEALGVDRRIVDTAHADERVRAHLARRTSAPAGCLPFTVERIRITYDAPTRATTARSTIRVRRPLAQLARILDPQCWKNCSDFFTESFRCSMKTYQPEPKPIGQSWRGALFERFEVPLASFDNVLIIDFSVKPKAIHVTYGLYDSLRFTFVGAESPGALEIDRGYVTARSVAGDPGWTEIEMEKVVCFKNLTPTPASGPVDDGEWLNYSAPAMLSAWIDEAHQTSLCCEAEWG